MDLTFTLLAVISAYLLGSIPTSVWVGRLFYGIDIREHGSGNAGATNTFRVLGKRAGIPVLLFDVFKGWAAVNIIKFVPDYIPESNAYINLQILLGMIAVVGHIFPIYAQFRGGKGVATLLGAILAIHPYAALISLSIFVVILLVSQYVSLSSIIGGITFPIVVIGIYQTKTLSLILFSCIIAVLLVLTHQKNIKRLLHNKESKVKFFKRKKRNTEENS